MPPTQGHPMARCSCHVPARRTRPPEPHCAFGSPSPSLVLWHCSCLHRANPGRVCLARLPLPLDAKQETCGWWPEGSSVRCLHSAATPECRRHGPEAATTVGHWTRTSGSLSGGPSHPALRPASRALSCPGRGLVLGPRSEEQPPSLGEGDPEQPAHLQVREEWEVADVDSGDLAAGRGSASLWPKCGPRARDRAHLLALPFIYRPGDLGQVGLLSEPVGEDQDLG